MALIELLYGEWHMNSPCGVARAGDDLIVIKKTTARQITYRVVHKIKKQINYVLHSLIMHCIKWHTERV